MRIGVLDSPPPDLASLLIIAIDGPSGAGKGTVARAVARELGYRHIDTGAMYRAVGWRALDQSVALDDETGVSTLARVADILVEDGVVSIDGRDITQGIRTPDIDKAAAAVARLQSVRDVLVGRQRELAAVGGVVMEGRDIGTVVFPDADVKIYLDATEEERARRRTNDPAHTGGQGGTAEVTASLQARDRSDTTRKASPLVRAEDADYVDTTGISVDAVVDQVMAVVRRVLPSRV
jgi:cytidylate kinase